MSGDGLRLSRVSRDNLALVTGLYGQAFDEPWPEAAVGDLMSVAGSWGLLACYDGVPAGFLLARSVVDEAEILTFGVARSHRRRGIGRALLDRAVEISSKTAGNLYLEVGADNPGACELYLKSGFEITGRRRNYYRRADRSRIDALIMRLPLGNNIDE